MAAGLVLWFARIRILTAAGQFLVDNCPPEKADAVVVLGGDEFGARILKGAQLAQAGWAPYVVVSGPFSLMGPESNTLILYAEKKGYQASLFRGVPNRSDSTESEAVAVGGDLKERGVHKILLVTSNYHTHRACRDWRAANPWLQVIPVAAPDPFFTPETWWKTHTGQKTFLLEWAKTIATYLGI